MDFQQRFLVSLSGQCGATNHALTVVRQYGDAHLPVLAVMPIQACSSLHLVSV